MEDFWQTLGRMGEEKERKRKGKKIRKGKEKDRRRKGNGKEKERKRRGKGEESIEDTAKVISSFSDIVMFRTFSHKSLLELSNLLNIPLINGLTDHSHPCQLLSDVLTFEENKGSIKGATPPRGS